MKSIKNKIEFKGKKYNIIKLLNEDNKIYIDPKKINNVGIQISPTIVSGDQISPTIVSGDWDLFYNDFTIKNAFFTSFFEVINKNKKWDDTKYLDKQNIKYEKRKNRLERWMNIYNDIKNNGWKEIGDYITINIGRNGDILFNDGQHRLTFAYALELKKIPVKIFMIHDNFIKGKKLKEIKHLI